MTSTELPDSGAADIVESHGTPAHHKPRRWVFGGIAALLLVGAAVGATLAAGPRDGNGKSDAGQQQTPCGQPRRNGTPLGLLLPKNRPAAEQRKLTHDALDGRELHACTISVDGHEAVSVMVTNMDPKHLPMGTTEDPRHFIDGGGLSASAAGALLMDYCSDTRSLVVIASVSLDSGFRPRPGDDQEPATRALSQLAREILTDQRLDVC